MYTTFPLRFVLVALPCLLALACRGPREGASEAKPTRIETATSDAAKRVLECQRHWNDDAMDAYSDCFGEPLLYRNNLGQETDARAEYFEAAKKARAKLEDATRRSIVVVSDGDAAFELWVESASTDGAHYGILGAQYWSEMDGQGAFHRVVSYLDPNHIQHQIGQATQLSRGSVALPKVEPRVLVRDDEAADAQLRVVRKQIQAFNDHDLDALRQTYAQDVQGMATTRAVDYRSREDILEPLPAQWSAHPNVEMEIVRLWGAGHFVVFEGIVRGTNTGDLAGMPATGRSFEQPFVEVLEVKDGAVVRFWRIADSLSVLRQLGFSQ